MEKQVTNYQNLDSYLNLYRAIMEQVCDSNVATAIIHEIGKDSKLAIMKYMQVSETQKKNKNKPATEKQLQYLERLGVKVEAGITKYEASKLIDQALVDMFGEREA